MANAVLVTFRDITERRQVEAALRTARGRLAVIFQRLADGVLVQDTAGTILYANDAAARFFDYDSARPLFRLRLATLYARVELLDEARQPFPPELLPGRRVLEGEEVPPITLGFRIIASGEERWASVSSTPVLDVLSGNQVVISILHDISERRRVEEELRGAIELRDAFLAAASHELRTPLTSLKGYLQVSQRQLQRGAPREVIAEALEVATRQVNRLNQLVGELLDVSRLSRGLFAIEPEPVELVPLLKRIIAAEAAMEQPARTITLTAPDPGPPIHADAARLEQVFVNLLQNARKYAPPNRPIMVRVKELPEAVAVAVHDEGIGIPPEDQPQVFQPFFRATNVDKGVTGFGLGLYIAAGMVRAHGGTLTLASSAGEGTTFTVTLPLGSPA